MLGDTVMLAPLKEPGSQTYVFAPLAVSVVEEPLHIVLLLALAVTVGKALTVAVTAVLEGVVRPLSVAST